MRTSIYGTAAGSSSAFVIDEKQAMVKEKTVFYRLMLRRTNSVAKYYICMYYEGEYCRRYISDNLHKASWIFEVMYRNRVTPCTFDYILEDMSFFD